MFLTPTDFTGKYELHTGMYDNDKLQSYIDKYEVRYLREMLGVTLYNEFISDLDFKVPQSPNFKNIFYPFAEDVNMYSMLESDGMLEMLKGFIYFEYSKDQMMQQTTFGGVQQKSETSKVLTSLQTLIYNRYNEAIRTYKSIQDYILLNTTAPTNQAVKVSKWSGGTNYSGGNNLAPFLMSNSPKILNLTFGGTLYTTAQSVPTIGGSGSGLTINYDASGGVITNISIKSSGSGYKVGDVLTVDAGNHDATFEIEEVYQYSNGQNCIIDYTANSIGGVRNKELIDLGTGYTDSLKVETTGGTGTGCKVDVQANIDGTIEIISIAVQGSGYAVGDVLTIDSGNADATFEVLTIWNGEIETMTIVDGGKNYNIGDFFGVTKSNINGDALFEVIYVGKGHYGDFKGQRKGMAYWI